MSAAPLDPPPSVAVEVLEDRSARARCDEGFLRLRRLVLRHRWGDGVVSPAYPYDVLDREALDAVALVLVDAEGPRLCLRSAIRPPLGLRGDGVPASQWEIPAGLLEPGETVEGCAARETHEEAGLDVAPADFEPLGPDVGLAPGVLGERLHFRVARVRSGDAVAPPTDGHPVEDRAEVRFVPLEAVAAAIDAGLVTDIKTELALHRLRRRLAERGPFG